MGPVSCLYFLLMHFTHIRSQIIADPTNHLFLPMLKYPLPIAVILRRRNKIFNLHLLKFACAENKISGSNFVPESFTDLGDSERNSHPGSIQNASEIHKHCLGSFRPEVSSIRRLFCRADKCFKHQVKHPFSCKRIFCSAARTNPFTDLICPEPSVAFFTFHQRICKVCNVAGCLPNFWIHNQSRINPHNILPKLNKPFPPSLFRSEEHT